MPWYALEVKFATAQLSWAIVENSTLCKLHAAVHAVNKKCMYWIRSYF